MVGRGAAVQTIAESPKGTTRLGVGVLDAMCTLWTLCRCSATNNLVDGLFEANFMCEEHFTSEAEQ